MAGSWRASARTAFFFLSQAALCQRKGRCTETTENGPLSLPTRGLRRVFRCLSLVRSGASYLNGCCRSATMRGRVRGELWNAYRVRVDVGRSDRDVNKRPVRFVPEEGGARQEEAKRRSRKSKPTDAVDQSSIP